MANKNTKPVGIEFEKNDLAQKFVPKYQEWYNRTFQEPSSYQNISKTLFQRRVTENLDIPFLEVCSSFHKRTQPEKRLILFVNCNPSGRDVEYYAAKNANHSDFCYYNQEDSLYKEASRFIKDLCMEADVDFAMADVFPIVKSTQKDLEVIWKNELKKSKTSDSNPFLELTNVFKKVVCDIQPDVIVAPNAFVTSLFGKGHLSDNKPQPVAVTDKLYYELVYEQLPKPIAAFCSGMLASRHAMDIHSRMRLIRDVREYLISLP